MFNFVRNIYTRITVKNERNVAFGFPKVQEFGNLLKERKYEDIEEMFENLETDEVSLLLDGLGMADTHLKEIFEWQSLEPDSYISNLFAGVASTFVAWEIRSGERAEYVGEEQFEGFWNKLEEGKEDLFKSISINGNNPEAYARLITIYMGLEEKENGLECFDMLMEKDSNHLRGHMALATFLAPKWFGSFEEMEQFALSSIENDKSELLHVIYLMYVMECYHEAEDSSEPKAKKMIKNKFRAKVKSLYDQVEITGIKSLQRYYLHNYYSYVFHLMDERSLRNREIDVIEKNISGLPWAFRRVDGIADLKIMKTK